MAGRLQAAGAFAVAILCACTTVVTMTVLGISIFPPQRFHYSLERDHTLVRISWGEQVMDLVGHDSV